LKVEAASRRFPVISHREITNDAAKYRVYFIGK
jgi:hypothetical protein